MEFELRPWKPSDLESLVKYANNWNIAKNLTDKFPYPYTESSGKIFIDYATKNKLNHIFAIDIKGKAIGGIGIHPQEDIFSHNAEMGYWLAESYWGKGIMTKAVKEMVDYGFKTFEINRIFARPFGPNKGSQKVLEKVGFTLEARFEKTIYKYGVYLDELVYAIRKPNL